MPILEMPRPEDTIYPVAWQPSTVVEVAPIKAMRFLFTVEGNTHAEYFSHGKKFAMRSPVNKACLAIGATMGLYSSVDDQLDHLDRMVNKGLRADTHSPLLVVEAASEADLVALPGSIEAEGDERMLVIPESLDQPSLIEITVRGMHWLAEQKINANKRGRP